MTDVLSGSARMLAAAWRIDRRKTVLALFLMIGGASAAPLLAAALGWMTNEVVAGRTDAAILAGVVVAVLGVVALTFEHFGHIAHFELSELAELAFGEQLAELSNGSRGIEHHERVEQADTLTVLQQESQQFQPSLEALLRIMGLGVSLVLTAVLLALANPLLI